MTPASKLRPKIQAGIDPAVDSTRRAIPFDYSFFFELKGEPSRVISSVVTVSIEASFTAVSIGYGVVPQVTPVIFGPPTVGIPGLIRQPTLRDITLGNILDGLNRALAKTPDFLSGESGPEAALKNGIKINPRLADLALLNGGQAVLAGNQLDQLFQAVSAPAGEVQFLYALIDEGSGRQFQSDPLLNTAGLGISNGDRPFRYFARPIVFAPRSTIRMDVTEVSDFKGELHVSLHGYKVLGGAGTPTGRGGKRMRRR